MCSNRGAQLGGRRRCGLRCLTASTGDALCASPVSFFHVWGAPMQAGFICKRLCVYSHMFNFSHLQSTLHPMQCTYREGFPLHQMVFELVDFDAFSASALSKLFPFQGFFHLGKQKKSLGRDLVHREGGAQGSCHFWSKTAELVWADALVNHPS